MVFIKKLKLKNNFFSFTLNTILLTIAFFAVTAISAQAACGDGVLDPGEVCDELAGVTIFMNGFDGNSISKCSDLGDTEVLTKVNPLVCVVGGCAIDHVLSLCSDGFQEPPQPTNAPTDFEDAVENTTNWILGFVTMIAVLAIIWGGIQYLTSAGNEEQTRSGKRTMTYALLGLIIAGIAYAIVKIIVTVILV